MLGKDMSETHSVGAWTGIARIGSPKAGCIDEAVYGHTGSIYGLSDHVCACE